MKLDFEQGNLVKIDGMRPEYMDGHQLLATVHRLAKLIYDADQILHSALGDDYPRHERVSRRHEFR